MKSAFFLLLFFVATALPAQGTLLTSVVNSEIEIENCARINDREVQFGPAVYGEDLVFLTRPRVGNIDPLTRKTYFKLFRSPLGRDGMPARAKKFSVELNSNYNEGPVSFTQEDRVIFFTRTQLDDGATIEDLNGKANLGIYSAYRAEYDWAGVRALPFNGRNFSNQHPSVTPDGRRVFFSSNREGGYGGYDLYFSDFFEGRWSDAINMGPDINTEANEAFPHIHPSGRLFFSSQGHGGQGGYDIFMVDLSGRRWGSVINLPTPVNSPGDDVGITLTPDGTRAYLASDREGGMGMDDIYMLRLKQGITSLQGPEIDGETFTVYDGANSRRVSGAQVWFGEVDPSGRLPASYYSFELEQKAGEKKLVPVVKPLGLLAPSSLRTDREGSLRLELTVGKTYELRVYKDGFSPDVLRFIYTKNGPSRPLVMTLLPNNCRLVSGRIWDVKGGGIENVPIQFRPENCNAASISTSTDAAGNYEICLPMGCNFMAVAGRPGYQTGTGRLSAEQLAGSELPVFDIALQPEGNVSRRGLNTVDAVLSLPGLNFFDNTAILQENLSPDLDLIQRLLETRPDVNFLIIAHTDGVGSQAELLQMGEKRAEAVRQSLLLRGVENNRLRTVSYGNAYRLRQCTNCTTADFAANTRLEAKVIGW
ncbi:OmpA family protein [Neolewinella aurantiaca]|uniref:OmpA family protein n=1 Tax=Neolewinella aurantiaca TaxID=2602767 RepID=A0A5C7FIL6_9BACT|nr:OmpA family protein [Neolewinella aurantiaca]TXF90993.1 OmpA family protein [Neolewinella aurantiaca]